MLTFDDCVAFTDCAQDRVREVRELSVVPALRLLADDGTQAPTQGAAEDGARKRPGQARP